MATAELQPYQLRDIVHAALAEDLGQGDITTDNLPMLQQQGVAEIRSRSAGILSGVEAAREVFHQVDETLVFEAVLPSGSPLEPGAVIARISGSVASILKAERTAVNFLQHLCGIATETRRYADAIQETGAKVTDTRKTTPGLRLLEKQAVLDGGGYNHRFNLGSAVMLKDNHIQAAGGIGEAVKLLREKVPHTARIEVETDTLEQLKEALLAGADIILLDNMTPAMVVEAVALTDGRAILEASGGITLDSIRDYANAGAQFISTSKITLGAPVLDIGLDLV